ncbi:MAG: arginine--tRNA ligase [Candidatus Lloydbacteria bacterium]|nr:arginine--tRNA ligase [Candidatus Lloydbacteria bacterium]
MIREELRKIVVEALANLGVADGAPTIERPADQNQGDYATNAALLYAKNLGKNPRELAAALAERLTLIKDSRIARVEAAGPGFVNFFLSDAAIFETAEKIGQEIPHGFSFWKSGAVNLEFISVNPTGKLHIGHGRGAFYGDVLARVLEYVGGSVTREFYINDSRESKQIIELGKTALGEGVQYKTLELESKIKTLRFSGKNESDAGFLLAKEVQKENAHFIEHTLGIPFDVWYSEDEKLRGSGIVRILFDVFNEKGFVYEKEGAWWIKTSEYGDDEDRVVKRSDGTWSYFMNDIVYHADKIGRGYDRLIDIWGADHHGHVKRMQAVKKMLGWDVEFEIFITQLVSLKAGGLTKKMSKRAGTVVLLEDMVEEVGIDALRWFYLEKALGTHMEFDVELAKKQSAENPVYYVQYAHARICSIEENTRGKTSDGSTLSDIAVPAARALASKVIQFAEVSEAVSNDYQVHKLTTYAYELASAFSQFYRDVRILHDDAPYNAGALKLALLARAALKQSLSLLGISAPEKM